MIKERKTSRFCVWVWLIEARRKKNVLLVASSLLRTSLLTWLVLSDYFSNWMFTAPISVLILFVWKIQRVNTNHMIIWFKLTSFHYISFVSIMFLFYPLISPILSSDSLSSWSTLISASAPSGPIGLYETSTSNRT